MKNRLILFLGIFLSLQAAANNMLLQNVTTTGNNASAKTIQVQFDLSWDNSWRDSINWDAAWIFIKFKDANGLWQHAQLNQTGFANGSGTGNTVKVTSDKVGCWVYRSALGSGTFIATGMQLQWNYGLSGLNDVTGLEIRVFATEMVYVPEGEFNCAGMAQYSRSFSFSSGNGRSNGIFNAPGNQFPVINNHLSPTLTYYDGLTLSLRIKGDIGIDFNNDGIVENSNYPTGYWAFYCYKFELTEQQYCDFLNTLNSIQISNLGLAGTGILNSNGQYFSSTPNKACNNSNSSRMLAYADWSGVRPISFLEFHKACYGPLQPVFTDIFCYSSFGPCFTMRGYCAWGAFNRPSGFSALATNVGYSSNSSSTRISSGSSYYGILELTGSAIEPVVRLNYSNFTNSNGNGTLNSSGNSDVSNWTNNGMLKFVDMHEENAGSYSSSNYGFRYCRSAE